MMGDLRVRLHRVVLSSFLHDSGRLKFLVTGLFFSYWKLALEHLNSRQPWSLRYFYLPFWLTLRPLRLRVFVFLPFDNYFRRTSDNHGLLYLLAFVQHHLLELLDLLVELFLLRLKLGNLLSIEPVSGVDFVIQFSVFFLGVHWDHVLHELVLVNVHGTIKSRDHLLRQLVLCLFGFFPFFGFHFDLCDSFLNLFFLLFHIDWTLVFLSFGQVTLVLSLPMIHEI